MHTPPPKKKRLTEMNRKRDRQTYIQTHKPIG